MGHPAPYSFMRSPQAGTHKWHLLTEGGEGKEVHKCQSCGLHFTFIPSRGPARPKHSIRRWWYPGLQWVYWQAPACPHTNVLAVTPLAETMRVLMEDGTAPTRAADLARLTLGEA